MCKLLFGSCASSLDGPSFGDKKSYQNPRCGLDQSTVRNASWSASFIWHSQPDERQRASPLMNFRALKTPHEETTSLSFP